MSAFARFGIKHLSPSSLNLWRDAPGLWTLKYLGGLRDDAGAAAWRGIAVEHGLQSWFTHPKADHEIHMKAALGEFETRAQGDLDGSVDAERKLIAPILERAIEAAKTIKPKYLGAQSKIEHTFPGVAIPVIGFLDFLFEDDSFVDLKTTKACPSSPRPDHARQVALYSTRRRGGGNLMYATPKRWEIYPVGENECAVALEGMRKDALALQSFLEGQRDAKSAIRCLPMNDTDFRWSQAATVKLQEVMA